MGFPAQPAHSITTLSAFCLAQHFPSADQELASYVSYLPTKQEIGSDTGLDFWIKDSLHYPLLTPVAQDLVAAPASQAYSERVFSLCGDLSARKRNRVSVNLERRVFLKMNKMYISSISN